MRIADRPERLDQIAAAYALGTLRGGARRRFEAMARDSAVVRTCALLWQERLSSLTELQSSDVPSANVWKRIENLIAAEQSSSGADAQGTPEPGTTPRELLRRALGWWRGAAVGGAMAAAFSLFAAFNLSQDVDRQKAELASAVSERAALQARAAQLTDIRYVSVLQNNQASAVMLVTIDRDRNVLTLKRVDGYQEPGDRSLELWALPEGGKPQSLGVLAEDRVIRLHGAGGQAARAPALAVSLEPKGGAPAAGGPTGPILFKGALLSTAI